jgi:gliding motility-associated-like protein
MRTKSFFLIVWSIIFTSLFGISQQYLDITYPGRVISGTTTPSVSLYSCESNPTTYSILVDNFSPFQLANVTYTFLLPPGIKYAGGFVGPTGSSVLSSGTDSVQIRLDTMQIGQVIRLSIDIVAECEVYNYASTGGNFDVQLRTEFTQVSNSYRQSRVHTFAPLDVKYPILQLIEKSFVGGTTINYNLSNPSIGDIIDRRIKIKNGGTSRLDTVVFTSTTHSSLRVMSYPSLGIPYVPAFVPGANSRQEIKLAGAAFTGIGNNDMYLDPGEEVTFFEKVEILDCQNTVSDFTASWGCGASACQTEQTENRIIFATSAPRISVNVAVDTSECYGVPSPGGQRMSMQLYNYAPNRLDSAENILIDVYQGVDGFSSNFMSVIDLSSIRVRDTAGNLVPYTVVRTSANNPALCNAAGTNSVGRFVIRIDKLYSLQRLTIKWKVESCVSNTCTNSNINLYDWGYSVTYENRCDNLFSLMNRRAMNSRDLRHDITTGTSTTLIHNTSGSTGFEFSIVNSHFDIPKNSATDYLRYEITKPSCLNFVASPSNVYIQRSDSTFLYPNASDIVVTGNTITVRFNSGFYNTNLGKLVVNLVPNCLSGCVPNPTEFINVRSFYKPSSCTVGEFELGCATTPVSIICNNGCFYFVYKLNKASSYFKRDQQSFGLRDYNNDGLPDANLVAQESRVQTEYATYGDVVKLRAQVNVDQDRNFVANRRIHFYSKLNNGELLNIDSVVIGYESVKGVFLNVPPFYTVLRHEVKDTVAPYTLIKRPVVGTDSVEYFISYDIRNLRTQGYFPDSTYSFSNLHFTAYYHVDSNPGLDIKTVGADFTVFPHNLPITNSTNITSMKSNWCFLMKEKIDVIGFDYNSHWNTYNSFQSCDTIQITERFRFNTGTWIYGNPATNFFKNEYRNFSYLDTLRVNASKLYNIQSARIIYYRTSGTLSLNKSASIDILPLLTGSGNSFSFDLGQLFKDPFVTNPAKPFVYGDEGYMADVQITFEPNCQNQGGLDTLVYTWITKTDSYEPKLANCNTPPRAIGNDRIEYVAPRPTIQPSIKTVRVEGKTVTWDVLLSNNSASDAANMWFGFNNPFTSLTINSVARIGGTMNLTAGTTVPNGAIANSGNGIYRIHDLVGGKDLLIRITATIDSTNCDLDSLVFTTGFNCYGYPSSIATNTCPVHEMALYAQPMLPTLYNSITTAADTIDLCDTAEFTLRIENTNVGRAYDILSDLYLQQYFNFVPGSAQIYDNASASWISISPSLVTSGHYVFDVSNALPTSLANGLVGITNPARNFVLIRFKATAECNFTSGSRIEISSSALAACGYQFNSLPSFGNPLHITGATPNHRNQVIVNSDFLSPCLDSTNVNVRVINLGPINTWVGDSVTVMLPRGVKYAAGTYSPVQNSTASAPSVINYGGREYLTWTLNNLVALTDTAEFNFKIYSQPDSILSCDANYLLAYTTTQDQVFCSTTGSACNVKIISGDTTKAIFTYKSTLNLSNPIATSIPNPPSGEQVTISFEINNLGQAISSSVGGNPIYTNVSIYKDIDGNGQYGFIDSLITISSSIKSIPQGISTFTDTINLPAGEGCNFIAVIDFDENTCVCNTSSVFFSTSTLLSNEPNDTVCEFEPTTIGFENPVNGYTYSWTAGNNASLTYLSATNVPAPIFTSPVVSGSIDSMEYFVQIDRMGCLGYDTIMVYVISVPDPIAGADTTVCYDSARLNANFISNTNGVTTYWTMDSTYGNGTAGVVIHNPSSRNSLVTGLFSGRYRFIWNVTNGTCAVRQDTMEVDVTNPIFTAGNDTVFCNVTSGLLSSTVSSRGFTYNWSLLTASSTFTGVSIANQTTLTPTISNLIDGVYFFELELIGAGCNFYDTVRVEANQMTKPNAGVDSSLCGLYTTNLWATAVPARRTGFWTLDSTMLNHTNISILNSTTPTSQVSFTNAGVYSLIWNSSNPSCGIMSDTVFISIFDSIVVDAGIDSSFCETFIIDLFGNSPRSVESGVWTQASGPSSVVFVTPNSPNSSVSGLTYGVYNFVWTISNGVCHSVSDTVQIIIDSLANSNAGFNDSVCVSNLAGYTLMASPIPSTHQGTWTQLNGTGVTFGAVNSPTTTLSGLAVGSYEFVWNVTNGVCDTVKDTVEVTVFDVSTSDAGNDDTVCISNTVGYTLNATPVTTPNTGSWTQLNGRGVTFGAVNSPSTTLSGLAVGNYEFVWNVTNGVCDTVKDTVEVTVFDVSSSNAGNDDTVCISNTAGYTLSATPVTTPNTGSWTQLNGTGVTFGAVNSPSTTLAGLAVGNYEFVWNVTNGVCDTVKDTVEVTVFDVSSSNAGNDDIVCISNTAGYTLNATPVTTPNTGSWTQLNGTGVTFGAVNSPTTTLSGLSAGTQEFVWNVTNGKCDTVKDTVRITVYDLPVVSAGRDTQTCSPVAVQLNGNNLTSFEDGVWTNIVSNPRTATFSDSSLSRPIVGNLNFGTYQFVWTVTNNLCASVSDTVTLIVDSISKPFAGLDDTLCLAQIYGMDADPVTGIDIGTWVQLSGPTAVTASSLNNPKAIISNLAVGTYQMEWVVSNASCPSVSDTVNITIMENSVADAGKDQLLCDTNLVQPLLSTFNHSQNYHFFNWSYDAASSSRASTPIITNPNSSVTTVSNLSMGRHHFVLTVSNGGFCPDATDTVVIEVLGKPVVDFVTPTTDFCLGECTDFTNLSTLSDSSASVISAMVWSFGDGQGSTQSNPTHCYDEIGNYDVKLVVLSNNGCVDSIVKPNLININPLPVAGFYTGTSTVNPGVQIQVTDDSRGATGFVYDFGDGSSSSNPNPIYNYRTAGVFTIRQAVINQFGCTDTSYQIMNVQERTALYVPSAFTPNNDGDNDIFLPVFNSVDSKRYNFKVFNRWGELLFETTDINEGWDGSHKGQKVPQGIYIWKVAYKEKEGFGVFNESGHVTIMW